MKTLFLIPARGGSKGLTGKNLKKLNGIALINHSVNFARKFADDNDICVSTDCNKIIKCVENNKLKVHFKRPSRLATDNAKTIDVIKHAVSYYKSIGVIYDTLILLQPTTPFRRLEDLVNMIDLWKDEFDMLVSVKETHNSPYFNLFEENEDGYLIKSKKSDITRRQDSPKIFAFNGSIYIYNIRTLMTKSFNEFKKIKKYVISNPIYSIDIDNELDWMFTKFLSKKIDNEKS